MTSGEIAKDIAEKISIIMQKLNVSFTLNGKPISYAEVFSESGLLPAIAKRADQLCSLCLGYGIGVSFENQPGSQTGKKVIFDTICPPALRYLCIVDVLNELSKTASDKRATSLDELLYD